MAAVLPFILRWSREVAMMHGYFRVFMGCISLDREFQCLGVTTCQQKSLPSSSNTGIRPGG